jgi:hypothetical protein
LDFFEIESSYLRFSRAPRADDAIAEQAADTPGTRVRMSSPIAARASPIVLSLSKGHLPFDTGPSTSSVLCSGRTAEVDRQSSRPMIPHAAR